MLNVTFIGWLNDGSKDFEFETSFEMVRVAQAFFKKALSDLDTVQGKKGKGSKRNLSSKEISGILERSLLAHTPEDAENFVRVNLNLKKIVSVQSGRIPQNSFSFCLNLAEDGEPIAALIIECSRQDFENLYQQIKGKRDLRLKLARKKRALKKREPEKKTNKPRIVKRSQRKKK